MSGYLDLDMFRRSFVEVVGRHSALRTQIVVCDGIPMQRVTESTDFRFELQELAVLPSHAQNSEVKRLIEELFSSLLRSQKGLCGRCVC